MPARSNGARSLIGRDRSAPSRGSAPVSAMIAPTVRPTESTKKLPSLISFSRAVCRRGVRGHDVAVVDLRSRRHRRCLVTFSCDAIVTGFAALLFDQADAVDHHAALDRLDHVVDGQARDRDGGQRLHFDAGLAGDRHGGAERRSPAAQRRVRCRPSPWTAPADGTAGSVRGALGRHDAGDAARCRARRPSWRRPRRIRSSVARRISTRPSATAMRSVAGLAETSTMRASPLLADMGEGGFADDLRASSGVRWAAARRRGRSSARVAAVTSACRIRLSPTRKVAMPDRLQPRQIGAGEDAALADQHAVARDAAAPGARWSRAWSRRSSGCGC